MKIILASASPRRKELLSQLNVTFDVIASDKTEVIDCSLSPSMVAQSLAEQKCSDIFASHSNCLVIGCDTIVVYNNLILGKPKNEADAIATLKMLSGNTHEVITGVCVMYGNKKILAYDSTQVVFNQLSEQFIKSYVDSGSPMDKAGSYGIQDAGVVKSCKGSYTNVMGLPTELLSSILKEVEND